MQTELEKTQLEIAKLQLEQEREKLAQMRQRQKVVDGLGQGAVAVGGAAVKGGSAVLRYVGRWLLWAVAIEACLLLILAVVAYKFPAATSDTPPLRAGWDYSLGYWYGLTAAPNLASVLLGATVAAFAPGRRGNESAMQILAFGTTAVIFAAWYFLR